MGSRSPAEPMRKFRVGDPHVPIRSLTMSRRLAFATTLLVAAIGLTACQSSEKAATTVQSATQAQMTPSLSTTDATFINTVGAAGVAEVQFGQLAQTQATRTAVRAFGAQM